MSAQKKIIMAGVFTSFVAAVLSVWGYARAGDPYDLASALFFGVASVFGVVTLRRLGPSDLSSFNPVGARRLVAKFIGFAAACWLLIVVRIHGGSQAWVDPLNVFVLLASLVSLILGLQFTLLLRESRRAQKP